MFEIEHLFGGIAWFIAGIFCIWLGICSIKDGNTIATYTGTTEATVTDIDRQTKYEETTITTWCTYSVDGTVYEQSCLD